MYEYNVGSCGHVTHISQGKCYNIYFFIFFPRWQHPLCDRKGESEASFLSLYTEKNIIFILIFQRSRVDYRGSERGIGGRGTEQGKGGGRGKGEGEKGKEERKRRNTYESRKKSFRIQQGRIICVIYENQVLSDGLACFRFNRRFSLAAMTERIANAVCWCMPCTERDLRVAEAYG